MAAFDLVSVDFKAWEAGGFGFVAVEQVAAGLVGIGVVGAFIDDDEAAENAAGLAVEGVFVEQVAGGVWGFVTLKRALIDDLLADGQADAEHVAAGTLADEVADALAAAEGGTELHLEAFHAGIASGGDAGKMQRLGIIGQLLAGGVGDLAAATADEIGDGDAEAAFSFETAVMIDDANLRVITGDDECVRKDSCVIADDPVEDFDGLFDDDVLRHDDDGARFDMRQMQRGKFIGAQSLFTLHEMLLKSRFVRFEGFLEADADHSGGKTVHVGLDEGVVHEDKSCRAFLEAFGGGESGFGLLGGRCLGRSVLGEFDLLRVRVAPVFVFEAGKWQGLEFGPRGAGTGSEPVGSDGARSWSDGEEAGGGGRWSGRH